ncbi:SPOR domain-containing protein [Phreatobacter sp.]|uniref:SPOR domain-containing protein n=1 Tax=Phreatobacter sp. TaxID=1966341 RepID=UPI003F724220
MRSYRDYDAYDREGRSGQTVAGSDGDPLADLIRIMGRDDAYAEVLKSIAGTQKQAAGAAAPEAGAAEEPLDLPAMDLRGSVPLQAEETDWDDLEAELEHFARQNPDHDQFGSHQPGHDGQDNQAGYYDEDEAHAPVRAAHEGWDGRSDADLERLLEDEFHRSAAESEPHWDAAAHDGLTDAELESHLARTLDRDGINAGHLAAGAGLAAGGLAAGAAVASWRSGAVASQPQGHAAMAHAPHAGPDAGIYAEADDFAPPRRRRAGLTAILAVVGLAVAGGGGVLAYRALTGGATVTGEPRVIRANSGPVRVAVQPPQAAAAATERAAEGERLVAREERPVSAREQEAQVQAPPAAPRVIPMGTASPRAPVGTVADPGPPPVRTVQATPVTGEIAARPPVPSAPVAAAASPSPFGAEAPRRVRTVPVGPDGRPVAPTQQAERPAPPPGGLPLSVVPTQPIQSRPTQVQVTPVQVVPAQQAAVPAPPTAGLAAADSRSAPAPQPRPPVRVARAEPAAEAPARSQPRGAGPLDLDPQRTASVRPQAPAAGGTFVQISSHQSEAEARSAFALAQRRFPVLQGQSLNIRAAEIPGRGTWHRLRVGPFSRSDAASFCERYRSAGGSCVLN